MKRPFQLVSSERGVAHVLLLLLLLGGVIIGVYLATHPQVFKPRAQEQSLNKNGYDSDVFEGFGINSFIDPDYTESNGWKLPSTSYEKIFPKASVKWVRVTVDWSLMQPQDPGGKTENIVYDENYVNKIADLISYANKNGYSVEAVVRSSPIWSDGWLEKLDELSKKDFIKGRNLQVNTGPLNEKGKQQLLLLSRKLFSDDRFSDVGIWGLYNEPNVPLWALFTGEGGRVFWHGHFGFVITNEGKHLVREQNGAVIALDGPYEFAQLMKIFYQGKLDTFSNTPVGYTGGAMWPHVGTGSTNRDTYDNNFDRRVLSTLKNICFPTSCFDVMNVHAYPIFNRGEGTGNQNCNTPIKNNQMSLTVNQPSQEDFFNCHDPYAFSEIRGKIRRVKYEMSNYLGDVKPIVVTETGRSWDHNEPVRELIMTGNVVKQLVELRSEGVDTIFWYDLSGRNGEGQGLFEHVYPAGAPYEPDKYSDGPVFVTFSQMAKMLSEYRYVKYGSLFNHDRENDPDRLDKGVISYLFKSKTEDKFREVVWNIDQNKTNKINIPVPFTQVKYGTTKQQGYPEERVERGAGELEIVGEMPLIVEYRTDQINKDKPFGFIDSPSEIKLSENRFFEVSGWVVSTDKSIDRVELLIDGTKRGELDYGLVRSDICRGADGFNQPDFFYPNCPFVGIYSSIDAQPLRLGLGEHRIEVVAVDGMGNRTNLPWPGDKQFGMLNLSSKITTQGMLLDQLPGNLKVVPVCKDNKPNLTISWDGSAGKAAEADGNNTGKVGYYVDISESSTFNTIYNKFVEGRSKETGLDGFKFANTGSNQGDSLNLESGKAYYVRVFNGLYSGTKVVTPPSCR